jgi:hypothetical protein
MHQSFFEFSKLTRGFTFHSKKTGYQIYRFELYWSGLNPKQCFERFDVRPIEREYSLN